MFRRVFLAGGVAVLVLLGYAVKQIAFPSPEAAVQRYFEALRARNLGEAAEQLADHYSLDSGLLVKMCETTAGVSATDCPYKGIDASGLKQVRWTEAGLPELSMEQSGLDSVRVSSVGQGSVRLNAVDAAGQSIDRVDTFSLKGRCVEKAGSVSCTFTA